MPVYKHLRQADKAAEYSAAVRRGPCAELAQENLHFAALKESTKEGQAYIAGLAAADVCVIVALMSIDVYTCV